MSYCVLLNLAFRLIWFNFGKFLRHEHFFFNLLEKVVSVISLENTDKNDQLIFGIFLVSSPVRFSLYVASSIALLKRNFLLSKIEESPPPREIRKTRASRLKNRNARLGFWRRMKFNFNTLTWCRAISVSVVVLLLEAAELFFDTLRLKCRYSGCSDWSDNRSRNWVRILWTPGCLR